MLSRTRDWILEIMRVLRDYALLADGRRGALIGPGGDICFLCVPDWHSPAVFATLLGGRGHYTVQPAGDRWVWGGSYRSGTLIWTSRWVTPTGVVECREALAYPGPADRVVVLRRIEAVDGDAVLDVSLDVRTGFGRTASRDLHRHRDGWTGRTGGLRWRWSGAPGGRLTTRLRVPAGGRHDLVLSIAAGGTDPPPVDAEEAWTTTERAWLDSVPDLAPCLARRDASHAATVLRGLTHPSGGLVAAATTSLPERAESGRDYDYRYVWIRDQCVAGQAYASAGVPDLLSGSVGYVAARLLDDGPHLTPAYTADGGAPVPAERTVTHLPGYPGGGSVKAGNNVHGQFQLDTFGEALLMFAAAGQSDLLDGDARKAMTLAADAIAHRWTEPDAGIWELDDRQWTHSKLICVAGLRAAARYAPGPSGATWSTLADAILVDTARHGSHRSGRWQRARDDPRVDAALLLPAIRGALPVTDPRGTATLEAVRAELVEDGYVYRYRPDSRPLGEAEGAFQLCGFTLARAVHEAGDPVGAVALFERSRAACGPAGLLSEEYDVTQRQLRGNLPQAFVHAMLLDTATAIAATPRACSAPD
jgi:hypothetical protein